MDHIGPMARSVRDCAVVLEAISQRRCDYSEAFPGSVSGTRIGVVSDLFGDWKSKEVGDLVEGTIARLRNMGATMVDAQIPDIAAIAKAGRELISVEASFHHRRWFPGRAGEYSPGVRRNLQNGMEIFGVDYVEALEKKRAFTEAVDHAFRDVNLLLCPTVPYPAPGENDPPTMFWRPDEGSRPEVSGRAVPDERTIPFNVSGHPALTVPAGYTASENLPIGVQMVAHRDDEATLFRVADAYEREMGGFLWPTI